MEKLQNARKSDIYQVSLLQSLLYGDYCGSVTFGELKKHGDTGIGTFHKLNGELILLDGEVYRALGDGSVETVSEKETTPFACAAYMHADAAQPLRDIPSYEALCEMLDRSVAEQGANRFYMIRIDGVFREMHLRSVPAQKEPYRPLAEVLEREQTFFDYENIEGTLVGLYCPLYMAALNAVGWHMHFISKDKTKGGHVLGASVAEAELAWSAADGFRLQLPENKEFDRFDLTVDQSEAIKKVETAR